MSFPHSIADGRYTLVEPLGVGGMATVFKAFDQRLQVWRAIKILSPQYSNRPSLKDRFEAEARTTALLEHRHIVKVYDVGRSGGAPYIVMELVEGGTLVDWVKRHGPMPPRMAVEVSIQAAEGVGAAHARKVVHRDVKPHNVLITNEGICRITDFGIARVGDDSDGLTRTGAVFGTWAYMAPEQRSDAKKVDARADVYSLGATLYFLLTGRTPVDLFAAEKDVSVLEGIHEHVTPALIKATQYARDERYGSVQAFIAGMQECLTRLPPDPEDTPPLARPAEPLPKTWAPHVESRPSGETMVPANARFGETMVPDQEVDLAQGFADSDQPSGNISEGSLLSAELSLPLPHTPDGSTRTQPDEDVVVPPPTSPTRPNRTWLVVTLLAVLLVVVLVATQRNPAPSVPSSPGAGLAAGGPGPEATPPGEGVVGTPEPGTPGSGAPGPGTPEPGAPEPGAPEPGTPDAGPPPAGTVGDTPASSKDKVRPPVTSKRARVKVAGDATEVRFGADGSWFPPGPLDPGNWKIEARFGDGPMSPAGELTVRAGETATVECSSPFRTCRKK